MHIPDGYLSPSTCAALYGAAAPFWYAAFRRVRKTLTSRTVPLVALCAAFSFVIMMFNLPLPGGTTGHALGIGIATVLLGPFVSILSISVALLIQSLLFGDGGITALGANCFNMAIIGPLAAYATYRLISRRAALNSPRRVLAAGFAGYAGINIAAICAAVEFGVQPLWFHDASGSPLYAPYPLSISIPAMMIGHLTLAGFAEFIISAGVIRYFQQTDSALLRVSAPDAPPLMGSGLAIERKQPPFALRKLWLALGLTLILTPLGLLAVGSAWGEWRATELSNPAARRQIEAVSAHQPLPRNVPAGLEKLASIWKAPISDYAPGFAGGRYFGYLASACIGVGMAVLLSWLLSGLAKTGSREEISESAGLGIAGRIKAVEAPDQPHRNSFVERTFQALLRAVRSALLAEDVARRDGFLQKLDVRAKLAGIASLIVAAVSVNRIWILLALLASSILLALLSKISAGLLGKRVWLPVLAFTGIVALPAVFLIPGRPMLAVPFFWPVSEQGVRSATLLVLRAETACSFSALLVLTTPWNYLLRALRFFRFPATLVVIAETTHRYVFLLLETAQNMLESRQVRLVGNLEPVHSRRLAAATVGVLLDKTLETSNDVYTAMQARGFRGRIYLLSESGIRTADWLYLAGCLAVAAIAIWLGR